MAIGLDYGRGETNIDRVTGIRYGVISVNSVDYFWEDAEAIYPEYADDDMDYDVECIGWKIEDKDFFAHCGNDGFGIFVERSAYYTYCVYCSPCAPGAGDLNNFSAHGVKTYCFGHDFFANGAPYPVYSVETDELISKD